MRGEMGGTAVAARRVALAEPLLGKLAALQIVLDLPGVDGGKTAAESEEPSAK